MEPIQRPKDVADEHVLCLVNWAFFVRVLGFAAPRSTLPKARFVETGLQSWVDDLCSGKRMRGTTFFDCNYTDTQDIFDKEYLSI